MAEEKSTEKTEIQKKSITGNLKSPRTIVVVVLLVVFIGFTVYAVMSDISIHGLTVRMYNVSRYCTLNPATSTKVVTFSINNAVVWSTTSLETSLAHVNFTLAADGLQVGTVSVNDASFGPGQSVSYPLTFKNLTIDPNSLQASSHLLLSITASVSAGFYSSWSTASDPEVVSFSGQTC